MPKAWKVMVVFAAVFAAGSLACNIRTEHEIRAHITLDIRHIRTDATSIEDYVSGETSLSELEKTGSGDSEPHAYLCGAPAGGPAWTRLFDFSSAARAGEPSVQLTEQMKAILDRRRARNSELERFKAMGCIGEKNDAYLAYRTCPECDRDPALKAAAEKLVRDESADRKAMFLEYLRQKGAPESQIGVVQLAWAEAFREKVKTGYWVQAPGDPGELAKFRNTPLGRKASQVQAGQWFQVP